MNFLSSKPTECLARTNHSGSDIIVASVPIGKLTCHFYSVILLGDATDWTRCTTNGNRQGIFEFGDTAAALVGDSDNEIFAGAIIGIGVGCPGCKTSNTLIGLVGDVGVVEAEYGRDGAGIIVTRSVPTAANIVIDKFRGVITIFGGYNPNAFGAGNLSIEIRFGELIGIISGIVAISGKNETGVETTSSKSASVVFGLDNCLVDAFGVDVTAIDNKTIISGNRRGVIGTVVVRIVTTLLRIETGDVVGILGKFSELIPEGLIGVVASIVFGDDRVVNVAQGFGLSIDFIAGHGQFEGALDSGEVAVHETDGKDGNEAENRDGDGDFNQSVATAMFAMPILESVF